MPLLGELVSSETVIYMVNAKDRRDLIEIMANCAHEKYGIDAKATIEAAMAREALGGTGVGEGVAVPHARIKDIDKSIGVFALLKEPVDFEGPDGRPADLVFLLLSPEESGANHLKALAKITRLMRQAAFRAALRAARSQSALHVLLSDVEASQVA